MLEHEYAWLEVTSSAHPHNFIFDKRKFIIVHFNFDA